MARRGEKAKREFLMLAHTFNPKTYHIPGWFLSEKLDGMRFYWDGGITRHMYADTVPWANVARDGRFVQRPVATGLWSRYGKVIHAPNWWLDELPNFPLDGELYMGRQQWQTLSSIVKKIEPNPLDWQSVKAAVFDSPPFEIIFSDGEINHPPHYVKTFRSFLPWVLVAAKEKGLRTIPAVNYLAYENMVRFLTHELKDNKVAYALQQDQLPHTSPAAIAKIEARLTEIVEGRGEGVVLRKHYSIWNPVRSHEVLKYKPFEDDEATVTGYVWGRETDKGSKLLGLMGAMILDYNGIRFELSGFTDQERVLTQTGARDNFQIFEEGTINPGKIVSKYWTNSTFPIGTRITFRFRELSDTGVPKEARYLRKEVV